MNTVEQLKQNSHLPGPRANLELLYAFSKTATEDEIRECLTLIKNDTENSPDEFAGICGIIYKIEEVNKASALEVVQFVRKKRTRQ